jgi:predicted naringenin-chalcone synthase
VDGCLQRVDGYKSARLREAAVATGVPSDVEKQQRDRKVKELLEVQRQEMLQRIGRTLEGSSSVGAMAAAKPIEAYKESVCGDPVVWY